MSHRVVVTGLGVISGLGFDWQIFWNNLVAGQTAIEPLHPDNSDYFPVQYAAPVNLSSFERAFADPPALLPLYPFPRAD